MHGIVNLMHVQLCSVCNAISYTMQDDRGSKLLWQNKTKIIRIFNLTNNSANISLRLFYNSLTLCRMCYVLSNGWLDSRSNSNIRKIACAGERHARVWDMGHWSIPPPLFEVMASRKRGLSVYGFLCTIFLL